MESQDDDCCLLQWVMNLLESQENLPTLSDTTDYEQEETICP